MAWRKRTRDMEPAMEWDAEQEARELGIAMTWWRGWTAEDEVEYERWLDALPKPTDAEIDDFEGRYLDSWERQAYVYGRKW